jgi:hypothetical protein
VTIEDNVAPVALCQDTIVQLDHSGNGILTTTMVDDGSSDACGIASLVVAPNTFTCADLGNNQVTLTVTDVNGNVSTCTSNVEVKDEVSPTAKCRDLTIQLDANGAASITVADIDNGTIDNCDQNPTITISKSSFGCADVGTNQVTLRAVDNFGNDATCISTITVEDNVAPTALCAADFSVQLSNVPGNGTASITVADIDNGSSDACGLASTTIDKSSFDCSDLGANVITLTVVDVNANISTCTTTVTVEDVSDPVITAAGFTQCNDPGTCDAAVSIVATATDNCNITISGWSAIVTPAPVYGLNSYQINGQQGLDASGTYPVGTVRVLFNVEDQSGNFDTLSVTVIIEDCDAPVITQAENLCNSTVTLQNVAGDCYQQYAWTTPTATDNCLDPQPIVRAPIAGGVSPLVLGGSTLALFPVGTTTVTYTATDGFNNVTTCSFDVVVEDTEDPVILNCPTAPLTANNDPGACSAQVVLPNNITANDNCPIVTLTDDVPAGSVFPVGTTPVTFTATDNWGNTSDCQFDVIVTDAEAPTVACPADITVSNDAGNCDAVVTYSVTTADNCAGETLTPGAGNIGSGNAFPVGTTTESFTVVDAAGNSAACSFTVTVNDTEAPTLSGCPSTDIILSNDAGQCSAVASWAPISINDNCAGATVSGSHASGDVFPVGTTTVTFSGADAAGNTVSCSFDVVVSDTEAPTITCPVTPLVFGNDPGDCDATIQYTIGFNDNCSATLAQTSGVGNGGSVPVGGSSTETYVVTDASGNTAGCSFVVSVEDREAPQVSGCPADITVNNDPGLCSAVVTWNTNNLTTSDNCPGETLASNFQSGDAIPVGVNTVTYVVTDAVGLTGSCSFTVTVNDIEAPVITCPANVTVTQDVSLSPNQCGANITGFIASATDNCSATITNDYNAGGANASGFYGLGTTTVTFTAADPAGNTDVCSATVTVNPAPASASVTNGNMDICSDDPNIVATGNNPGQGFSGQWTVTPATGVVIGSPSASASSITFPGAGTYTVTWTVTNDCDPATNASASFTVNVFDKPSLAISGTGPTLVGGNDGTATVVATGGSGSFGYSWSNGGTTATITGLTQGTYTVTVTDLVSGCVETASITLNDPALEQVCYVRDSDPSNFGVNFRLLGGSIPGNGSYTWNGLGTFHYFASGEVHIFGSIVDKVDATKEWYVDLWLSPVQFPSTWFGAGNGYAGPLGTNTSGWRFHRLNGSKSIMIGQQSFLGSQINLTDRSYPANGGPGGWQWGTGANNFDGDYGMYGQFDYTGAFAGFGELSVDFTGCFSTFRLRPVAVLEGAFDGASGLMRDDLRTASLVPTTEPYTGMGYTHIGGGNETVSQTVLTTTGPDAIVDWVVLELRDENAPATVVASRSALLQADGDIVDVDGNSAVEFENIPNGNYHVAVLHRNHVGMMTANIVPVQVSNTPTAIDFTTAPIYGGPTAHATVGAGFKALISGDASGDGQVQNTDDVYSWQPTVGSAGYQGADYDLDGQVQNSDKVNHWITNAGLGTSIPK